MAISLSLRKFFKMQCFVGIDLDAWKLCIYEFTRWDNYASRVGLSVSFLKSLRKKRWIISKETNTPVFRNFSGGNEWFKPNFRIFNSSSDKFLVERFLTTSSCVKGLLLFFVKFHNFFSWVVIIDCSFFFMLRKSNFLIISQPFVLSFDLIVVSIFLNILPKAFLSRMRLCILLYLNFFL